MINHQPTEEDWLHINDFKMPPLYLGCQVHFYGSGDLTGDPKWGIVSKIEDKTVQIRLMDADVWLRLMEAVRHKDDPRLEFFPNLKSKGVWALHPSEVARRREIQDLKDRMTALEGGSVLGCGPLGSDGKDDEQEPEGNPNWGKITAANSDDIIRWSEEGKKPTEIAELLGAGWTALKVGKAIKKLKSKQAEQLATAS